jgi:hypothetical protein
LTAQAIEAPLSETSRTRQLCTSPFGRMSFEVLLLAGHDALVLSLLA